MTSKLKLRRQRRLKADLNWWREEARDLHARVMEQADELAYLRLQLATIRGATAEVQPTSTWRPAARCDVCVEGARGGCSTCSFNKN